jgi:vacuolar-type H+-ATPase subunit I/STV1
MFVNPELEKARRKAEALQAEAAQVKADYEQRMEAIRKNADLSQEGKNKAIKTLLTEQRAKIDGLVNKLRRAAVDEAAAADLSRGVRDLVKKEYSNWDYGRLAYEANRVRSAFVLAGGDDFDKIQEAWQQVKARGDKYEIKAWMDTAPAIMPAAPALSTYAAQTRQTVIEDIAASEVHTLTDEGKKFEAERAERTQNLELIASAAAQVSDNLSQLGTFARSVNGETYQPGSGLQRNHVIARVFDGIALDRQTGALHIDRVPGESAEEMYNRTEAAYQESAKQLNDYAERFSGEKFDTLVHGIE